MLRFPRPLVALLCAASLLLAACGTTAGGTSGAKPGQLNIVTAFYPFQFIAERVAGPHAAVSSLTQPGAEPHDLELTPKQTASVGTADLVIYEKTFQAAVDEAVAQSGNEQVLDTTSVVPLKEVGSEHEHGEEHADEEGEEGHDHGGLDPHVWLDPANVATIADAVAQKLSELDPDHATDYAENLKTLTAELEGLDQEFTTGLQSCERTEFITTHAAFGYLAERYGLDQIGISGLNPDAQPSPARIADIHKEAEQHQITTIFYETLVSPAVAESIAADLKLKTAVLDPIEGITKDSPGQDYVAVMKANLRALQDANGCS